MDMWIVYYIDNDGFCTKKIMGAFSTKELAEQAIEDLKTNNLMNYVVSYQKLDKWFTIVC